MLTGDVYAAWIPGHSESVGSAAMVMALGAGDAAEVARLLHNDLEPAAFALRPALAEGKRALVEAGALGAGMSGSGPALFGMARDREHAHEVARRVRSCFDRVIVTKSFTPCIERL